MDNQWAEQNEGNRPIQHIWVLCVPLHPSLVLKENKPLFPPSLHEIARKTRRELTDLDYVINDKHSLLNDL